MKYCIWHRYHTFALKLWTKNLLFLRPQLSLKSKTNTNQQQIGCLVYSEITQISERSLYNPDRVSTVEEVKKTGHGRICPSTKTKKPLKRFISTLIKFNYLVSLLCLTYKYIVSDQIIRLRFQGCMKGHLRLRIQSL